MADYFNMQIPGISSIDHFNRFCRVAAALWLFISIPLGIVLRPTVPDFDQFYIGGRLVSGGEFNALYPVPKHSSLDNPGLFLHSTAKPRWKALCRELGVRDYTHFMLPPPSALLFAPFAFLSYNQAFWAYTLVLTACVWATALVAASLMRSLVGKASHYEGVLMLLISFSPMTARSIRIANVSPLVALSIGLVFLALIREDKQDCARGAIAFLVGAIFKYATLVLAPLLVAMRRWRMLFFLMAIGALIMIAALAFAGVAPFVEFYQRILPTLSRPSAFRGNQSIAGLLARTYGRPLSPELSFVLNGTRLMTLAMAAGIILTRRRTFWENPVNILAAGGLLMSWLLMFSPIAWEHWPIFLCPLWGWLLFEAREALAPRIAAFTSMALMSFPAGLFHVKGFARYNVTLPEPFNSTQLMGVGIFAVLAFRRLLSR